VQKNGGKITADIVQADYVILSPQSNRSQTTYTYLFESALAENQVPLQPVFVRDCIQENALLETDNYAIPTPKGLRGARPSAKAGHDSPRRKIASSRKGALRDKKEDSEEYFLPKKRARMSGMDEIIRELNANSKPEDGTQATPSAEGPSDSDDKSGGSSPIFGPPSPAPPAAPPGWNKNSNTKQRYSEDDRQFFEDYLSVLLFRDRHMSSIAVGQKMYQKVTHFKV
jgi:hypothetical protein